MRLRRLEVENFRGMRSLDWRHIADTAALVGPGDSGKSTILDAIERVLSPRWNVPFDDTDFWELDTQATIVIRATLTDLAPSFYRDTKFGLLLHGYNAERGQGVPATGVEGEEHALVIELEVDASLEPSWQVLDAEGGKHPINARDREALGMLRVGGYVDQHLGWSRGSVLARLTETGDGVGAVLADATRQARAGLKTDGLDKLRVAAARVEALAKQLGVALRESLVPHLDAASLSVAAGALSLHDGKVPTRRAGLGTRRLLAVAMQREAGSQFGLTIVDEFEHGLEPHRIRRLLRVLRGRPPEGRELAKGQLVLTTHSPTVLHELEAPEVGVTRRGADGTVSVRSLPAACSNVLRRAPGALLARKVIVAEGVTEMGLCNAFDEAWSTTTGSNFAYAGVAVVDGGGGTQPAEIAGHLATLGYETALFVDSDATAKVGKANGATVLAWPGRVCTEQRLALDLPLQALREMTVIAHGRRGRSARDAVADELKVARSNLDEDRPETWVDAVELASYRVAFGAAAQRNSWFKTREYGAALGRLVIAHWDEIDNTPTRALITQLRGFAIG